jgi:hypothetical protein
MANDLTSNPLILDTAAAGDVLSANAPAKIKKLRWVVLTGGVAADTCVLTDSAGKVIWECANQGALANFNLETDFGSAGHKVRGLKLPTIARGKLYVYVQA